MDEAVRKILLNQSYQIAGNHSACKICEWTKKSLRDEDVCYKEQFYGIKCHMCCQMTPCLLCTNECLYCWRDPSITTNINFKKIDEPKQIIEDSIAAQKKLLSGFGGNPKTNLQKFKEAQDPKYFAISLNGEPMLYPHMNGFLEELHKQKRCSFLVTNGLVTKRLANLNKLPTQLYISLDAPTKEIYKKLDRPRISNYWERFNETLELLPSLDTRKVLRITLVKDWNMNHEEEYAKLIKKADPDFIEVKAYMWIGCSKSRLEMHNMPRHPEVQEFSKKLGELTSRKIINEKENSRVTLLAYEDNKKRFIKL